MSETERRQLKIKTSTVKRLKKELDMYEKEYEAEAAKFNKLKDSGADAHDIKYAEKILSESSMMIPDTRQRLQAAVDELTAYVEEVAAALAEAEELAAAREVLTDSAAVPAKA